ncbi:MAG: DinB family protein [Acidobacteriia bacterium]|nr:DinB family protein [Terriglobia bacterium]
MSNLPETLERFRRGPELLAVVLTGVYGEETDFTPAPGKWSIRQIVAHLADGELVGAHRFRQVIAEDNPTLIAFDQDAWVANLDYARRQPKQSLESFRRVRAENYELLKALPETAFERKGMHSERGALTLLQMLEYFADHAESHARQMQAIREEYKKLKGKKG